MHDIVLVGNYSYGFRSSPGQAAYMQKKDSGGFARISRWQQALRKYYLTWDNADIETAYALLTFFHCRKGRTYSFKFIDWLDFTSAEDGVADASPTGDDQDIVLDNEGRYRFAKKYDDQVRLIYCPSTWKITDDGVDVTSSCSVNTNNGVITGYTPSGAFKASFGFYTPVRFESFLHAPVFNEPDETGKVDVTVANIVTSLVEVLL